MAGWTVLSLVVVLTLLLRYAVRPVCAILKIAKMHKGCERYAGYARWAMVPMFVLAIAMIVYGW